MAMMMVTDRLVSCSHHPRSRNLSALCLHLIMEAPTTIQVEVYAGRKKTSLLRSLKLPITLTFPPSPPPTVRDVKASIAKAFPKLYVDRQKVSLPEVPKALSDESVIIFGPAGKAELVLGDLGPQIAWKTVFVVEYVRVSVIIQCVHPSHRTKLGPLIIHPLFYHLPQLIYRTDVQHSALQKSVYAMCILHFVKRELETLFLLPVFTDSRMRPCPPETSSKSASAHYWLLSGVFIAYDIYRPRFSAPLVAGTWRDGPILTLGWALWAFAELSNFKTHMITRALRPAGTTTRAVPMGYGFSAPFNLAAPNYFFEILAWTAVLGMTGSIGAGIFWVFSAGQMVQWALKKHRNYKKEFGDKYPRNRRAMIPFIL
ncbi:unnamed protein product [Mycena citricolor]|uniref:3-oxo-5-alpha-steroid 4-dehydrogenase C-terminal domain-containing protein n=1 Tax=Mycena citricolor TaxID=2018698 RepID=A0AAD2Q0V4_9AGAR|nr:unnamed protein product [Mycena citricolor]